MATVHATAVLAGAHAILIQGPSGCGKSRLALTLLQAAQAGQLRFARLVADDRVELEACHGRLVARPPAALAGMIEVRGLGIRHLPYEPAVVIGLMVELAAEDAQRLPMSAKVAVAGILLPRIAIAEGADPLPIVLAALSGGLGTRRVIAEK